MQTRSPGYEERNSKYLPIGPTDRDTHVRDHPSFNIRVQIPLFVPERVRDKQRLMGLHHGLAIKPRIERCDFVRFVRIPVGLAGYEDFDVGGSTLIIKAEGTCMISASRFMIACHLGAI